jgi:hypothetical protein
MDVTSTFVVIWDDGWSITIDEAEHAIDFISRIRSSTAPCTAKKILQFLMKWFMLSHSAPKQHKQLYGDTAIG